MENGATVAPGTPGRSGRGVLYVATGRKFVEEALASLATLRTSNPQLPAAIVTDETTLAETSFDHVIPHPKPSGTNHDKQAGLRYTPFRETLFLDSDTLVCRDLADFFRLLERFEIVLTHDQLRQGSNPDLPKCFIECNGGVMLYRDTERVWTFLEQWGREMKITRETRGHFYDQPALRKTLWESDVRFYVATSEFNLRTCFPFLAGGEVAILHGRHNEELVTRINESHDLRVYLSSLAQATPRNLGFVSARSDRLFRRVAAVLARLRSLLTWGRKAR